MWLYKKEMEMVKTIEELRKLNTNNLLRLYRAERKRFNQTGYTCDCCGEFVWDIRPKAEIKRKQEYDTQKSYLDLMKVELATREHVPKNGKNHGKKKTSSRRNIHRKH